MARFGATCMGLLFGDALGHGAMFEPSTRNSQGWSVNVPSCPGGSCLFFAQGAGIGCPNVTGHPTWRDTLFRPCTQPDQPTIHFRNQLLGTLNLRAEGLLHPMSHFDWTKFHPWRYPGASPVVDPCGIASGETHDGNPLNGARPPPGIPHGMRGSRMPKLFKETVWIAGSITEVAWAIAANHGGGYQYRLCPADEELTEECFQRMPLEFVGNVSWLQYGPDGLDTANRTAIKATRVSEGTFPSGSTWSKNPVPMCGDSYTGGACDVHRLHPLRCNAPAFPPPAPGVFGLGQAACTLEPRDMDATHHRCTCTTEDFVKHSLQFGIVDQVRVPLTPGKYVLAWRWDTEQTPQVWGNCADVTIVKEDEGEPTVPFQRYAGCESCCIGTCANCTRCVNDKTGDCAYCWNPLPGFRPAHIPRAQCLGHEDESGGAPLWFPGEERKLWSPGCTKCWADRGCERQSHTTVI